jgi:hypothetical protein
MRLGCFSVEDDAMFGKPLRSHNKSRSERPSFKPCLEALESREVPTCAQTSAAFNELPTNVNNLVASINARDVNGINTNINLVANDMFQLAAGAPGFIPSNRTLIDTALITDGIVLIFNGFKSFAFIPIPQFENVVQLGATAARVGFIDLLQTGFFPGTSGNCVLT